MQGKLEPLAWTPNKHFCTNAWLLGYMSAHHFQGNGRTVAHFFDHAKLLHCAVLLSCRSSEPFCASYGRALVSHPSVLWIEGRAVLFTSPLQHSFLGVCQGAVLYRPLALVHDPL